MNILVLNVGSSSVKYEIFPNHLTTNQPVIGGMIEEIGRHAHLIVGNARQQVAAANIHEALRLVFFQLRKEKIALHAIGHRVVHGGGLHAPVRITLKLLDELRKLSVLAPLHNPPQIEAIEACMKLFSVPQVAVFDTAFYHAMPAHASLYAIPYELAQKHRIKRYGFHGTSHQYVAQEACRILNKEMRRLRMITCHLGNGCSITAIKNGKAVDTSMGFTPLEGLMMGARSGDIDPSIVPFLMEQEHLSSTDVERMLNEQSGLLGVSGVSNDIRAIMKTKSARARLAVDMFVYRIAKCIGAYVAAMNGVDVIVFTAGIGEHQAMIRERVTGYFAYLGIVLDKKKNHENASVVSDKRSKAIVMVVPTNEALMIARETARVVRSK